MSAHDLEALAEKAMDAYYAGRMKWPELTAGTRDQWRKVAEAIAYRPLEKADASEHKQDEPKRLTLADVADILSKLTNDDMGRVLLLAQSLRELEPARAKYENMKREIDISIADLQKVTL